MHGIIISLYIVYVHRVPKSYPVWLNIFSHTCKSWLHLIHQITIHVILGHPDCQPCLPLFSLQLSFENQSSKNNNSWKWLQDFLSPQLSFIYMYMYILCVILHSCTHGYVHLSLYSTKECFRWQYSLVLRLLPDYQYYVQKNGSNTEYDTLIPPLSYHS